MSWRDFPLPALNANPDFITSVGFEAGSFMSMELHCAYPELIKGVGLLSGGPPGSYIGGKDGLHNTKYEMLRQKGKSDKTYQYLFNAVFNSNVKRMEKLEKYKQIGP